MSLAIFDLDNTLLGGDSDYLWGEFLVEHGIVERAHFQRENKRFYKDYQGGNLDIYAFLNFQLGILAQHDMETLHLWRARFLGEKIVAIMLPKARELIQTHRHRGDDLLIITATNRFVTAPIAAAFGITELLATEPEIIDGRYSGRVAGVPCFREGKVTRLTAWLTEKGLSLEQSWFYSDSHNDLALLEKVTHPVAVDPDPILSNCAKAKGWPVISLRNL